MAYFDWEVYVENYADLAGMNESEARSHYVKQGEAEGRSSFMVDHFSWVDYIINKPELNQSTRMEAYRHYLKSGRRAGQPHPGLTS